MAVIYCRGLEGLNSPPVKVEVFLSGGLPTLNIVGLPETAVRESKDRVRSALKSAGFEVPVSRITVNLAPADLPKQGGRFDLPIAIAILAATKQLPASDLPNYELYGELSLDGSINPVRGLLPSLLAARGGDRELIIPTGNQAVAGLVSGLAARTASHLLAVCEHFRGQALPRCPPAENLSSAIPVPDLLDVRGQSLARRALEIAAAGGHSLLNLYASSIVKRLYRNAMMGKSQPNWLVLVDDSQQVALVELLCHAPRSQKEQVNKMLVAPPEPEDADDAQSRVSAVITYLRQGGLHATQE
ncbi:MAG: ATP-binding protein [Proteobacteria bacterium]|nr:ATP-binding protein [Pseudomonadota bacterium]